MRDKVNFRKTLWWFVKLVFIVWAFPYVSLVVMRMTLIGGEILKTENIISDSKDRVLNMAVERALYLPSDDWSEQQYFKWSKNGWSRWCDVQELSAPTMETYKSCRRHIRDGMECNGWYLTWFRYGDCRRLTLPIEYWESENIKIRILDAINNPCDYLLPPPPPEKIHPDAPDEPGRDYIWQHIVTDYARCRMPSKGFKGKVIVGLYNNRSGLLQDTIEILLQ